MSRLFFANLALEELEERCLLAGTVVVDVADGDMGVLGDNLANRITVTEVNGNIVVTGIATDIVTNTPRAVRIVGNTAIINRASVHDDIKFILNGGNDFVFMNADVSDDLKVLAGDGNDRILVGAIQVLDGSNGGPDKTPGIDLGNGNDIVAFIGTQYARDLDVNAGAGNDIVALNGGIYGRDINADGGPGGLFFNFDVLTTRMTAPTIAGIFTDVNFERRVFV